MGLPMGCANCWILPSFKRTNFRKPNVGNFSNSWYLLCFKQLQVSLSTNNYHCCYNAKKTEKNQHILLIL